MIEVDRRIAPTLSNYRTIPMLMEVLEAEPGFREAAAVLDETHSMLSELKRKKAEASPGFDNDTIVEYGEIPASWLDSIGAARIEQETIALQIAAVEALQTQATYRLESIAAMSAESLLSTLSAKMDAVLSEVRAAVDGMDTASTPLEAIENGTTDSWRALTVARGEYNRLRMAQEKVMISAGNDVWQRAKGRNRDIPNSSYAIIRNLDEVHPKFSFGDADTPWPYDTTEFLVWATRNGVELWLPSINELTRHMDERKSWFDEKTRELAERIRSNAAEVFAEIRSGSIHPHVQEQLRQWGLL
ncbi:hypothetical protein ACWDSF_03330 [Nocardia beijingensis]